MPHEICPWWMGYALLCPLRRRWQDPHTLLARYVLPGMTALEPGPGMGYFTLELLRLVGPRGRVVAVDIQPKMLATLARRASKAGLRERLELREPVGASLGVADLTGGVDFVLAAAVVHELPDAALFFREAYSVLKPGGRLLLGEPAGHVQPAAWAATLALGAAAGFETQPTPPVRRSHSALLVKPVR